MMKNVTTVHIFPLPNDLRHSLLL